MIKIKRRKTDKTINKKAKNVKAKNEKSKM